MDRTPFLIGRVLYGAIIHSLLRQTAAQYHQYDILIYRENCDKIK